MDPSLLVTLLYVKLGHDSLMVTPSTYHSSHSIGLRNKSPIISSSHPTFLFIGVTFTDFFIECRHNIFPLLSIVMASSIDLPLVAFCPLGIDTTHKMFLWGCKLSRRVLPYLTLLIESLRSIDVGFLDIVTSLMTSSSSLSGVDITQNASPQGFMLSR